MATPRKFQEKIAQLQQKQDEGNAEFEKIMSEVQGLRNTQQRLLSQQRCQQQIPPTSQQHASRPAHGGSLPDFSINLSSAVSDLQTLRQEIYHGGVTITSSLAHSRYSPIPSPHHHPHVLSTSPGRLSTRPTHLSPPLEVLSRSISDSSIHQHTYQGKIMGGASFRKVTAGGSGGGPGGGIEGGGGTLTNTSSLPDLTQVPNFQLANSPIPEPDSTLPSIIPGSPHSGHSFAPQSLGMNGPFNAGGNSPRGTSPGPSPSPIRKLKQKPYQQPLVLPRGSSSPQNKNFLPVPSLNERFLHMCKGVVTNNSPTSMSYIANGGRNIYGQPLSPCGSHPTSPNQMPFMDYRNPVSPQLSRSNSPVSNLSPQTGALSGHYRSSSPDSRSAPPSPGCLQQNTSPSPVSSPAMVVGKPFNYEHFVQVPTHQLNEQFENFNMMDTPPCSTSGTFVAISSVSNQNLMNMSLESGGSGYFSSANTPSPPGPLPPYPQGMSPSSPQMLPSHSHSLSSTAHLPSSSPVQYISSSGSSGLQSSHSPQQIPLSSLGQVLTGLSCHQGPLSPLDPIVSLSNSLPPTPQTPQTPTTIPAIVIEDDSAGLLPTDSILQDLGINIDDISASNLLMTIGVPEDFNMVEDDQLQVDQETEDSFRRDHQSFPSLLYQTPISMSSPQYQTEQLLQHSFPQQPIPVTDPTQSLTGTSSVAREVT